MAKLLLFADAHIHTHKGSLKRLQHCLDALKWALQTAVDRKIDNVLFLGDLFQDREKIQVLPYQRTYEIINSYCGGNPYLNLYMLIGNHDMWFANKTDVSSIYPFGSIKGIRIIRKCETINIGGLDIDFLPFTLNPLKSIEAFKQSQSKILCGHIALDGAQLNTFYKVQADVSVEYDGDMVKVGANKFQPWERVFLGHYHGEQKVGHVEYVGSPLQLNFAEAFQKKHVIELETEDLSTTYIENTFSPHHIIMTEDDWEDEHHVFKNSFIKFQPKDISASWLVDFKRQVIEKDGALSFEITAPKPQEDEVTKERIKDAKDAFLMNREELLEEFLGQATFPENIDSDKLLAIGKNIMQESQIE